MLEICSLTKKDREGKGKQDTREMRATSYIAWVQLVKRRGVKRRKKRRRRDRFRERKEGEVGSAIGGWQRETQKQSKQKRGRVAASLCLLLLSCMLSTIRKGPTIKHPWMLDYVSKPQPIRVITCTLPFQDCHCKALRGKKALQQSRGSLRNGLYLEVNQRAAYSCTNNVVAVPIAREWERVAKGPVKITPQMADWLSISSVFQAVIIFE